MSHGGEPCREPTEHRCCQTTQLQHGWHLLNQRMTPDSIQPIRVDVIPQFNHLRAEHYMAVFSGWGNHLFFPSSCHLSKVCRFLPVSLPATRRGAHACEWDRKLFLQGCAWGYWNINERCAEALSSLCAPALAVLDQTGSDLALS